MGKGPFLIEVKFFDEVSRKMDTEKSITFAESFQDCMENIYAYYRDTIESVNIKGLEESPVLVISDDVFKLLDK